MTELVAVEIVKKKNVLDVFKPDNVDILLQKITEEVDNHNYDLETATGRKKIATLAAQVSRSKTFIDGCGKELVAEWKAKSSAVDKERKRFRDECDKLRDKARKPLTEWEEAEDARKLAITGRIEDIKRMAEVAGLGSKEINSRINELELLNIDESFAEYVPEAATTKDSTIVKLRSLREEKYKEEEKDKELQRLKEEAAERERVARENKIREDERQRILVEQEQAIKAQEAAEKKRIDEMEAEKRQAIADANAKVEAAKIAAEQKIKDAQLAELKRQEQDRLAVEQKRKADEARAANIQHRKDINNAVLRGVMSCVEISEESAKKLIKEIALGNIPHTSILY